MNHPQLLPHSEHPAVEQQLPVRCSLLAQGSCMAEPHVFLGPVPSLVWVCVHALLSTASTCSVPGTWRGCQELGWEQWVFHAQEGQKLRSARNSSVIGAGTVRPRFKTHPLPLPKLKLIYSLKTMGLSSPLSVLWFCAARNYDGIKMLVFFLSLGL